MIPTWSSSPVRRGLLAAGAAISLAVLPIMALMLTAGGSSPAAAASAVDLGTAKTFGVLAGSAVTNTGPSIVRGDLGVSPGTSVTGFPPGTVLGTIHAADAVALQAQSDLTTAYNALASQPSDETISADLAGRTLTTGVYTSASTMSLSGDLTLDAQGDPDAVFIFQVGSGLTIASGSNITLVNGAQACNVFWQVGSSATLGTNSTFVGTIVALTSISAGTGATVDGRLLARNGAVTLDTNTINVPTCATTPTTTPPTTTPPTTTPPTTTPPTTTPPTTTPPTTTPPTTTPPTTTPPTTTPTSGPGGPGGPGGPDGPGDGTPPGFVPPTGFPDTGDGGSVDGSSPALIGAGAFSLLLAGGLLLWWRRGEPAD